MSDPFALTPAAPAAPGPGFLGIPSSTWQNLANFGANTAVAANARTPGGFLEYGTSPAGALGEGMLQTEQQAKDTAGQMAQQGLVGAQMQGQQLSNLQNELMIPKTAMLSRLYSDPQALNSFIQTGQMPGGNGSQSQATPDQSQGGGYGAAAPSGGMDPSQGMPQARNSYPTIPQQVGPASATGATPNAPGSEGTDPYLQVISGIESGGQPGARNAQGYSGLYGQGAAALADAGVYKPAQGEDLSKNTFQGTFNVPGYEPMSYAQYMVNPQAQAAAAKTQEAKNWQDIQTNHLDYAIGQNIGGVQITQPALLGMIHVGGLQGTINFLKTGGQYNPPDANGTTISMYANKVNAGMLQYYQNNGAQAPSSYDPNRQVNAQDTIGPFTPAGGVTAGKAQQEISQLSDQMQRAKLLGLPTDGLEAQIKMLTPMATAPYQNTAIRENGGAVIGGQFVKMSGPTSLVGPGNVSVPAAEYGGYSVNGQEQSPAQITIAQQAGAVPPPAATAPPPPTQGVPGVRGVQPPGQPTQAGQQAGAAPGQNSYFDAALTGGPLPPSAPSSGQMLAKPDPYVEETIKNKTDAIDIQQREEDADSQEAELSLSQMQNMKFEGADIQKDNFAPYRQDFRTSLLALGHSFGFSDSDMSSIADTSGNVAALQKNTMSFTMNAAKETSSRMAVQEVQMLQQATPNLTMPNHGYQIVTDQIAGLAQYRIARSQAFSKWNASLASADPGQRVAQINAGFDAQFNQKITPMTFIANQWMQSPDGQSYMGQYLQYLQKQGPRGQAQITLLRNQLAYGEQTGLFNASAGGQ